MALSKDYQSTILTIGIDGSLILDDYTVPHVKVKEAFSGGFAVTLDGRFGIDIADREELQRWGWMMANGMAVAAGFTSFGKTSAVRNPYGPKVL